MIIIRGIILKSKIHFFHKCKLCIVWSLFIAKISLAKIFVLWLFKIVAYQIEYSITEQRSVIKFWVAEKCEPCEIYRRMSDVCREVSFNQKMFTNVLKHRFATMSLSQKNSL